MKILNELNTKHEFIKFEYLISKTSITFSDTEVYIKKNKLSTKICRTFFSINSEYPKSLKSSIPYSHTLRIKIICLKKPYLEYHLQDLARFIKQGYNKKIINQQFSEVKAIDRKQLLKEKDT